MTFLLASYLFILFVCSYLVVRKYFTDGISVLFPMIILTALFTEACGYLLAKNGESNQNLYTCFLIITICLITCYYFISSNSKLIRISNISALLLMVTITIIQMIHFNEIILLTKQMVLSSLLISLTSIISLLNIFNSSNKIILKNNPHFWLSVNFLLFWSILFFSFQFRMSISVQFPKLNSVLQIIITLIAIVYYSVFTFVICHFKDFTPYDRK